jgi:Leucine-rich repeat (LRR) protein
MEDLITLTSLRELKLTCNGIKHIGNISGGFFKLEVGLLLMCLTILISLHQCLDLSFNKISQESILNLSKLRNLEHLDLSFNDLTAIPSPSVNTNETSTFFPSLEILILEQNKLSEQSIVLLGLLPK